MRDARWAAVVGMMSALVTACVFVVALVVALLLEFIITGHICEIVDESAATIGGRICGATSLLAFVVGFVVALRRAGKPSMRESEEPVRPWSRG